MAKDIFKFLPNLVTLDSRAERSVTTSLFLLSCSYSDTSIIRLKLKPFLKSKSSTEPQHSSRGSHFNLLKGEKEI